ncbi:hypothetical protein Poli38472_000698 [Pythium oligandrum]|uniref:Acid phosphatase n=1 Tax=Pythium oligandrum TaxID=41045 RepID=A0A8K1CD03_PYTOL|nr:hypothetical protein Poli38472_000698 [Pythium oligandrum]|eukprot:TMW60656.1 hypothetical protein Poli38472_000698 [Pythium oligandrum]
MASGRLTLRQLQVLHRHGDRSPLRNVFRGADAATEALEVTRWETRLQTDTRTTALGDRFQLDHRHPIVTSLQTRPFGCLTQKGIEQMEARGSLLAAFCAQEGLSFSTMGLDDVKVYCNAYLRTQMSVQGLLTGLFADHAHLDPLIQVLAPHEDMIHTYTVYPEIAELKVQMDRENDALKTREHEMAKQKAELMTLLPSYRVALDPFQWMTCYDYFTCRAAHELPLIPGTEALEDDTLRHITFRFNQFYSHRRIRSLLVGMLLDNVLQEMTKAQQEASDAKKLIVYSGHDVSILAILHAIDAEIVHNEKWWPGYSSAVSLELLEDEAGKWFVQTRIDGAVLGLRPIGQPSPVAHDEFVGIIHDKNDLKAT